MSLASSASLTLQLIRREIAGRYRGSVLGVLWSLVTPLLMLGVYTVVFGTLFQSRWARPDGGELQGTGAFAIVLFAGLIVFQLFGDVIGRGPTLVLGNANYVKKVVFPLEILPLVAVGSALFHSSVSMLVLLGFRIAIMGGVPLTALLVPVILAPFLLLLLGLEWFLASIGVYFRDISQILGPLLTALMFLSPIFIPVRSLPAWLQGWHLLNPLSLPVESLRAVLIFGQLPDWGALAVYSVVAAGIAWLGYVFFQKTRKGFADVL